MKKIILNESQLKKLLNESPYDSIKSLIKKGGDLKQGHGTLSGTVLATMSDDLYDAIKGPGTDLDTIRDNFNKCKNFHDVKNLFYKFKQRKGASLLEWLDGDINYNSEWDRNVLRPLSNAYDVSTRDGHFKEKEAQDETEKLIMGKFPCLADTPNYKFKRADKGILYFDVGSDEYGVKVDGTLYKHNGTNWIAFPEKTKCTGSKYQNITEQNINEQGLDLNPGGETTKTSTTDATPTTGTTTTGTTTTPETTTATTETGDWITNFQTQLKKNGVGQHLGTTGPNGDGIDGKLGAKTATAAYSLLKSKGIISEKNISEISLNEGIIKNFKRFL